MNNNNIKTDIRAAREEDMTRMHHAELFSQSPQGAVALPASISAVSNDSKNDLQNEKDLQAGARVLCTMKATKTNKKEKTAFTKSARRVLRKEYKKQRKVKGRRKRQLVLTEAGSFADYFDPKYWESDSDEEDFKTSVGYLGEDFMDLFDDLSSLVDTKIPILEYLATSQPAHKTLQFIDRMLRSLPRGEEIAHLWKRARNNKLICNLVLMLIASWAFKQCKNKRQVAALLAVILVNKFSIKHSVAMGVVYNILGSELCTEVRSEAASDRLRAAGTWLIDGIKESWGTLKDFQSSPMSDTAVRALGAMYHWGFLYDIKLPKKYWGELPRPSGILPTLEAIVDFICNIYDFIARLWETGSISQAINAGLCDITEEYLYLKLMYEGAMVATTPNPAYISPPDFLYRAKIAISKLEEAAAFNPLNTKQLAQKIFLEKAHARVFSLNKSKTRIRPLAISVFGESSIGKASIISLIGKWQCEALGIPVSSDIIFSRGTSTYWEGFDDSVHKIIHLSELGARKKQIVQSKGDPRLEEVLSLIDNAPFYPDMAFDDKGKVTATPYCVLVDTNFQEMGADVILEKVGAFMRRFVTINVRVKPEFATPTGALDSSKALADGSFNYWLFDIITYASGAGRSYTSTRENVESLDMPQLKEAVIARMQRHMYQQKQLAESLAQHGLRDPEAKSEAYEIPQGSGDVFTALTVGVVGYCFYQLPTFLKFLVLGVLIVTLRRNHGLLKAVLLSIVRQYVPDIVDSAGTVVKGKIEENKDVIRDTISDNVLGAFPAMASRVRTGIFNTLLPGNPIPAVSKKGKVLKQHMSAIAQEVPQYMEDFKQGATSTLSAAQDRVTSAEPLTSDELRVILTIIGTGVALYFGRGAITKLFEKIGDKTENEPNARPEAVLSKDMSDIHALVGAGRSYTRIKPKFGQVWNTMYKTPPKDTNGIDTLAAQVSRNTKLVWSTGDKKLKSHILGYKNGWALVNRHFISVHEYPFEMRVSTRPFEEDDMDYYTAIKIREKDVIHVSGDVCLVATTGISYRNISEHFCVPTNDLGTLCKGKILDLNVSVTKNIGTISMVDKNLGSMDLHSPYAYDWEDRPTGACGIPLLVECGKGAVILGIHSAGSPGFGYAERLNKNVIESALSTHTESFSYGAPILTLPQNRPHRKSPLMWKSYPYLNFIGSDGQAKMLNKKSALVRTNYADAICTAIDTSFFNIEGNPKFGAPLMVPKVNKDGKYLSPFGIALDKMNTEKATLDQDVIDKIVDILVKRAKKYFPKKLAPYEMHYAINGDEKDCYFRSINLSTSAGYGFSGTKEQYIDRCDDGFRPKPELVNKIADKLKIYDSERRTGAVFRAQLKDEARVYEKVIAGKTRVFYMSALDDLVMARMFLAPFYTHLVEHSDAFCTAVGINMSSSAGPTRAKLVEFSECIMEGDYSSYDTSMPYQIGEAAARVIYETLKNCGYNEAALRMVKGILTDSLNPIIEINGDFFEVPGLQASGMLGTAENNSLRGLILLMYAWYTNKMTKHLDFFEYVRPLLYGDDMLAAVKPEVIEYYNNNTYQKVCREVYKMNFTSASKSDVMEPYLSIDEVSFLKRKFVFRHDLQEWVAQLDMDSIMKAMTLVLPSNTVSPAKQALDTLNSSLYELFNWLEEQPFLNVREELAEIHADAYGFSCDAVLSGLPQWHEIRENIFGSPIGIVEAVH